MQIFMKPHPQQGAQRQLFRTPLVQLIDKHHELVRLGQVIEWGRFEEKFGATFSEKIGRPGIPTRLMVALHYLKHLHDLSDEQAVKRWTENPYWQHFSGGEYFEHRLPFDRSSMSRWRKKVDVEGVILLLQETLSVAVRTNTLRMLELDELLADTTVQEKNVTFPTDPKLYHRARVLLVKQAKEFGIEFRQSYTRLSKRALIQASRYSAAKQMKRARREVKKVRNYLGRVLRDVKRYVEGKEAIFPHFEELLKLSERVYMMKERGEKIYSLHEQHVECIAKGKAHKRYEFGVKISVLSTKKHGFILACDAHHGNPYDGHTLKPSLEQAAALLGRKLRGAIGVDLGYRGHGVKDLKVVHPRRKRLVPKLRALVRKRSKIEAIISHLKRSYRMGRNFLAGKLGDRINAMLAAAAYNFGIVLRKFQITSAA